MVRFSSTNSPSLTQVAARKQLRKHIRRIREREYSKLRALVPAVATKKKVTKVQVIEEAVRYIEELHTALIERFRQKHGCGAESMAQETVRSFVTQMMPPLAPLRPSPHLHNHNHHHHHHHQLHHHAHPHTHPLTRPQGHPHPHSYPRGGLGSSSSSSAPAAPLPAFLSACTFEKQRKRASFLLSRRRRRDC
ncbi:uncharacterized protein LOC143286595 [Babylonia areolata]|uniref:uncharacterized protein LOC143286595 n=1 Tax=Babylonia areolata TaxID=304850 RepID=UPI003FD33D90